MNIAKSAADHKDELKKENISLGWWRHFQGDLSLRRRDNTASVHMDAVNEENHVKSF